MAFTFDAVPTSATMNSYVSVSDADDFFASKYIPSDAEPWSELETAVKQALLCSATRVLNTFIYGGLKTSQAQPLQWPRSGMYTNEGTAWPSATVAVPMQQATCEQAFWIWQEQNRELSDTALQQYEGFKAGPLDLKIRKNPLANISADALALINSMGIGSLISTGDTGGPKTMNMSL
jgi:hypothetical protein